MEKLIPSALKRQVLTTLKFPSATPPLLSQSCLKNIQKELERKTSQTPTLKLATFYDLEAFHFYLNEKIPVSLRSSICYFLNSKVMPGMIPKGSNLSVFDPSLFKSAIKVTEPKKITFSNPFKTLESLTETANLGIRTVVVNTLDEIQSIQKTKLNFKYVWEFDEINHKEARSIFKTLANRKLSLSGLSFKDIPLGLFSEIEKTLQVGYKYGHELTSNSFQLGVEEIPAFKMGSKAANLKMMPVITNLDTSRFTLCAAKVIGKNTRTKVYDERIEEILGEERKGEARVTLSVKGKQWTVFSPSRSRDLCEISCDISNSSLYSD